ncbi:ABC transporter permease subunit [bacterium]|jgi:phosphonate transport system permease protein|nr:ABC transporter permease subunit [Verrucomicrobiales bacterium]MDB2327213.1 ABC transporter permease subunit [bacterium]MDA7644288.1 ABC transporter permease subunit [Verrucomicrobiales bacterium]MDB4772445.1 ABC transporter permease subunit [Verrucomicrobiales bacterium]MDC0503785.1 ABC transporter permease subunit [Verrucomicrobiales bacterium]
MNRAAHWLGPRRSALLGILLAGMIGAWLIQLDPAQLFGRAQWHQLGEFFKAALRPALAYEDPNPASDGVFLSEIGFAIYKTLLYAAAAIGLSLIGGLVFGLIGSTRAWLALASPAKPFRVLSMSSMFLVRLVMTILRSVHEIIWAILFLQALGNLPLAAVIAIAIPYSATLGKVFSELIDEAPRATAEGLRANGASVLQVYVFGLLPTVLPDLFAYLLYRFECGLRSAAVLGFFGAPTLGYYLSLSWGERHFHEVWAYLYALLAIIVVCDLWSGAVRQRLTTHHAA